MHLKLKKSQLTNWWVAEKGNLMAFYNIFSDKQVQKKRLKVLGYYDNTDEIAQSENYVVLITKKGVITAQGSFYPFEEAHELYLQFLIKANEKDTVIARRWKFVDEQERFILADIIKNGKVKEGIAFDFMPDEAREIVFSGVSAQLSSKVLISTFSRRDVGCLIIHGVADIVKADIKKSSFAPEEITHKRVKKVKKILNEVTKGGKIVVNCE